MIMYALKFIQFVVRDTSKKRIKVVCDLERMRETASLLEHQWTGRSGFLPSSAQLTEQNAAQVFKI